MVRRSGPTAAKRSRPGRARLRKPRKLSAARRKRYFKELERGIDPEFAARLMPFLKGLHDHYFRCDISGWENIPRRDPEDPASGSCTALYIGNHNGLLTFEVLMLFYSWWNRTGGRETARGLAHTVALRHPAFSWLVQRLGGVPAHPEVAVEALRRGISLMIYPGGEKESFRPWKDRKKVDFFGRTGWIRLARQAGVPIVPIVSVGAHESYVILDRGEEIARRLGLYERLRLHGVPITFRSLFFAWCVATGVFTFFPLLLAPAAFAAVFVPLPSKMTFRVLAPFDINAHWDPELSDAENERRIYDLIVGEMSRVHEDEYSKRRFPILG